MFGVVGKDMLAMTIVKRCICYTLFSTLLMAQIATVQTRASASENLCLSEDAPGCTFGLPTFQYQLLLSEMMAHPTPNVRPLQVDESELGRSDLMRIVGGTA